METAKTMEEAVIKAVMLEADVVDHESISNTDGFIKRSYNLTSVGS